MTMPEPTTTLVLEAPRAVADRILGEAREKLRRDANTDPPTGLLLERAQRMLLDAAAVALDDAGDKLLDLAWESWPPDVVVVGKVRELADRAREALDALDELGWPDVVRDE